MSIEKKDFDKEAATYDEKPERVKLANDIANAITQQITLSPSIDVMDFGCGTGLVSVNLQPHVSTIMGVDSSQGMLDIFNAKISKLKLSNVSTQLLDLDKGVSLTGKYDLVVSSMTLHHVKEIKPLLDQFYKAIAPGGYLCIADLDLDDGQFHDDNTGVFHFGFDRAALRNVFEKAGFLNIDDRDVAEVLRPGKDGKKRAFKVFLMTAQRPQ